jgi:glycosyltransferase involved in cell wall biosynthesis
MNEMMHSQENVKISLIIPIYNVAEFLPKCLDSVRLQTHKNLEIILVNDGSTDASGEIAEDYARQDSRIKVVHTQNSGVSSARNVGLTIATGEYICFADSDDYLEEDYVDYLLNLAVSNDAEISLTTRMFTTFYDSPQVKKDRVTVNNGVDAAIYILYYHIPIGCYCKLFKRCFLEENNIRFISDVYIGEGFNFNIAAFQRAKKVVIGNRKIYCYRQNNTTSAMTKFVSHKAEMAIKAIDIIRDSLISMDEKLSKACDYADWHTHADMYNWMVRAKAKKDYPELYAKCYLKTRNYSFKALFAPVSTVERFRALIQFIHPALLAKMINIKRIFCNMIK